MGARYDPPAEGYDDHDQQWQTSSSSLEDLSDAQPGATSESDYEHEAPEFIPGYYRAVYAFEPDEGSSEMALEEEQIVRCLDRGGGDGWVIAVKEPKPGAMDNGQETGHALVPEGYLEFLRPFDSGDSSDQGGCMTPRTSSRS